MMHGLTFFHSFASDDVKKESLILASSTDRRRATLIKVWSHCQIAFRSLWMPELLLPQPSPDYSISQSHCQLKIRWRIHAVQPYLNLAHTLRSMGFHYKFLPCTPGIYDPINVRICCFFLSLHTTSTNYKNLEDPYKAFRTNIHVEVKICMRVYFQPQR